MMILCVFVALKASSQCAEEHGDPVQLEALWVVQRLVAVNFLGLIQAIQADSLPLEKRYRSHQPFLGIFGEGASDAVSER